MRTLSIVLAALMVLLLAVGGVTAHEDHGDTPVNESTGDWATWMEQHMTEYMGAEAAEWMQEWMGMSYEEMGAHMGSHQGSSMMGGMGCH